MIVRKIKVRKTVEIARHAGIRDASFDENFPPRRQRKSVTMLAGTDEAWGER